MPLPDPLFILPRDLSPGLIALGNPIGVSDTILRGASVLHPGMETEVLNWWRFCGWLEGVLGWRHSTGA